MMLPPLPGSSSAANNWDLVEGLSVELLQGSAPVSGQYILRLIASGTNSRHALAARFRAPASAGSELIAVLRARSFWRGTLLATIDVIGNSSDMWLTERMLRKLSAVDLPFFFQ